ncbi:MAG: alpha-L-fucosidase [Verrucomicrobia bacterium]|nr:alpha-L-fucosidase [Verrucomicrobiota bacterium]MDI9380334.1 alpha-L-fucosidase [Verrucomicrobiota bacterium]NMD18784.1 alpha-L-fucosidase [Verrucomicrobiota bacterium]HNU99503.1 alpha-L-fucosidase [Verrucomicrobiota bacterium]HOA60678.1 alpha-L-fucosidase [Verrucomicrobiota bacterium]
MTCVGGDGNFLLNVRPMRTGEIEAHQAERLKEMGAWLASVKSVKSVVREWSSEAMPEFEPPQLAPTRAPHEFSQAQSSRA